MKVLHKLWQTGILCVLLLLGGTQMVYAAADDDYKKGQYFTVQLKEGRYFYFDIMHSNESGIDCWTRRSSPTKVTIYEPNGSTTTKEIFSLDGYQDSEELNFRLKHGAVEFLNLTKGERILENLTPGEDTSTKVWTTEYGDIYSVHFNWYPPQEWLDSAYVFDFNIHVTYWDNDWKPFSGGHEYYDRDYPNNNGGQHFDVRGQLPKFSITGKEFMNSASDDVVGNMWKVNYSTSSEIDHYYSSDEPKKSKSASKDKKAFFEPVSDKARKIVYNVNYLRNDKMKLPVNKYWAYKDSVELPAYHKIQNLTYNSQQRLLLWELHDVDQKDQVPDDAFCIESSRYPNFTDAKQVAVFDFTVGTASASSHSTRTGNTQKFQFTVPEGENGIYFRIQRRSSQKLGWDHMLSASCGVNTFISDLCVSVADNSTEARSALLSQGYKLMDFNLNNGVKGDYVYLGYKETDNPLNAISRIAIRRGDKWAIDRDTTYAEGGYTMLPVPAMGIGSGNLTQGIPGGQPMYLYYSRDNAKGKGKSLITHILHASAKSSLSKGYSYACESLTADAQNPDNAINLNQNSSGMKGEVYLVSMMHEHISEFSCRKEGEGAYAGHDCCGIYLDNKSKSLHIYNVGELLLLHDLVQAGLTDIKAELMADIVLNKDVLNKDGFLNEKARNTFRVWQPIGSVDKKYGGSFDGHGHCISGVYASGIGMYASVFGALEGAQIRNLIIRDTYIEANAYAGGISDRVFQSTKNATIIDNCMFQGFLDGVKSGDVGGLVAYTNAPRLQIIGCHTTGRIRIFSKSYARGVGGIVGSVFANGVTMSSCFGEMISDYEKYKGLSNYIDKLTVKDSYCTSGGDTKNVRVSKEQMASGHLAYLLNAGGEGYWGQLLPDDQQPFLLISDTVKAKQPVRVYRQKGIDCTSGKIVEIEKYTNVPFTESIVHVHLAHHAEKAPTCTDKGNLEYWTCPDCGKLFANGDCTTQILRVPEIAETGHHDYDAFDVCTLCKQSRSDIEQDEADGLAPLPIEEGSGERLEQYDLSGRRITTAAERGIIIQRDAHGNVRKKLVR